MRWKKGENMRTNKYLANICKEMYRKMYKEAEPSADFDKLMESGETKKENWFMNYYLPTKRQGEIFDSIIKKYKCNRWEREKISFEVWLGSAPTGIKKSI